MGRPVSEKLLLPQGGAPIVISWFINPINYGYNHLINPSYWTYLYQLS